MKQSYLNVVLRMMRFSISDTENYWKTSELCIYATGVEHITWLLVEIL